nr:MAG TPA: Putative stress-responsive nuclear envelope protein [Caudoviricetes sp.]
MAIPDETWTIPEIKKYLDVKGIDYKSSDTKPALLSKVGG